MVRIIFGCIFIFLALTFALSGMLNWKTFMYVIPKANVWIDTFGFTFYRIMISIIGIICVAITIWTLIMQ